MPRVKIDYVVSFSSEDADHPASNLLEWEVSKKKWLCKRGESSCSVVLQLTKAVKISAVHIGAYHAALVEVLVARSEKASDQYQVLVPSCVFVAPAESRRGAGVERVRSFGGSQFARDVCEQRWDRVRLVCSQPYNKHCKYGISFIHINEASSSTAMAPGPTPILTPAPGPVPQRLLTLDTFSSDEDDFRPGELFAKHLQKSSDSQNSTSDTGAQIRQATSKALKNISDSCSKLVKTPISKPSGERECRDMSDTCEPADRARDSLLYTHDEQRPHAKIDHVVQRHKDHRDMEEKAKHQVHKANESVHKMKDDTRTPKRKQTSPSPPKLSKQVDSTSTDHKNKTDDKKKRPRLDSEETEGAESAEPHTILRDVVLVLSGYQNPQRAQVRNTALALGATVRRDWGPDCTHLICAFPNTPKLRAVREGGGAVRAATAHWLTHCAAARRRLPWRRFATEPEQRRTASQSPRRAASPPPRRAASPPPRRAASPPPRRAASPPPRRAASPPPRRAASPPPRRAASPPPRPAPPPPSHHDSDCDTDDEIEKVLRQQRDKRGASKDESPAQSPSRRPSPGGDAPHYGASTDEEEEKEEVGRLSGALPNFLEGYTFAIEADEAGAGRLARYVAAYGGEVLQLSQLEADSSVDYVVRGRGECVNRACAVRGKRVTAAWLARCHRAGALLAPDD